MQKVRHAGGAPAQSCEGRTGPSLHPPHPWPTLPFSRRFIIIIKLFNSLSRLHQHINQLIIFHTNKKVIAGPFASLAMTVLQSIIFYFLTAIRKAWPPCLDFTTYTPEVLTTRDVIALRSSTPRVENEATFLPCASKTL